MAKNANHISHKKNKQIIEGKPKLPLASDLVEGEIAINFGKDVETISIKNESGDVVTFSSDNYFINEKGGFKRETNPSADTKVGLVNSLSQYYDTNIGKGAVIEGDGNTDNPIIASGDYSHAEGQGTQASGFYSHAEGQSTVASGIYSHAEGYLTKASGNYSHAEGNRTTASGQSSHAEGSSSTASGSYSHAEGYSTAASGYCTHAEGHGTKASGFYSHTEGYSTIASGQSSHAEGSNTKANGNYSHAEGFNTKANNQSEHASGQYNVSSSASTTFGNSGNTLFSVGNGTGEDSRHNAFEIRQNGDIYISSGGTDILLQDNLGGVVDQVIDSGTSASTNAVATKAVYDVITDNELVWTNAYVAMSGIVSSHTENTEIHVTAADKEKLHTHTNKASLDSITGDVGTMAYEAASSYSSATEVNTALRNKANTSDIANFFDNAKYEDSGSTKVINFYHGNTVKATIDASNFIKDGMVDDVRIENGNLVIDFNTDAGKQDISIPLTDIFDPSNYYNKTAIDNLVGSGFTSSSITDVIIENEEIVASALNDLNSNINTHISDSSVHIKSGGEVIYKLENMSGKAGGTNLCASWSGDCNGITELYDGLNIQLKMPNAGHASGCTISINGGEQHRCILNASTSYTTQYPAGSIVRFVYDSNQSGNVYTGSSTPLSVQGVWKVSDYNTNTTYTVMPSTYLLNGKYKAYTNIYRYQILLSKDEEYLLPINETSNSTASTKVLTTEEFDIFGPIYYYGSTATTNANAVIDTGRTYISTSINLAYSFNTTTTLTPNKNVYMVVVPQTNNKAKLHSSPISQELPTTDDGLVYVLLGVAYSTSQIALEFRHPLYHFKNGKIREYTGVNDSAYMDVDSELTPSSSTSNNLITAKAVYDAISDIEGQMEVISSALNDLNTNKADKSTTYTKSEIDDMIGDIETLLAAI